MKAFALVVFCLVSIGLVGCGDGGSQPNPQGGGNPPGPGPVIGGRGNPGVGSPSGNTGKMGPHEKPAKIELEGFSGVRKSYAVIGSSPIQAPNLWLLQNDAVVRRNSLKNSFHGKYVYVDDANQNHFDLRIDYKLATKRRKQVAPARKYGFYTVNYAQIAADPFLERHNIDVDSLYPDDLSDSEITVILTDLMSKVQLASDKTGLQHILDEVKKPISISPAEVPNPTVRKIYEKNKQKVNALFRKRVRRVYEGAIANTTNKVPMGDFYPGMEFIVPSNNSKKDPDWLALLAFDLANNAERCFDGLGDGLNVVENHIFGQDQPDNMGDFISRVLKDYVMDKFIPDYASMMQDFDEIQTTAAQLMRLRMFVSLGLRGNGAPVAHPEVGALYDDRFMPANVMNSFIKGNRARLTYDTVQGNTVVSSRDVLIDFEPYDVELMIKLLQASRERSMLDSKGIKLIHKNENGRRLTADMITEFFSNKKEDPTIADDFEDFMVVNAGATDSEYFIAAPAGDFYGNFRVKDKFWLHLLERYGYIVRN